LVCLPSWSTARRESFWWWEFCRRDQ